MGNHCSSELCRGQRHITMKLLLLTVSATVGLALAEPEAPVFPSIDAPFGTPHSSAVAPTTWGFPSVKAKRSAEAPVFPSIEAPFGTPHGSAVAPTTWGFPSVKAKRSVEAPVFPIKAPFGIPHSSAVAPTTWGFPGTKAKRSAEPEANPGLLYYPYLLPVPVVHAVKPIVHKFPESEGEGVAAYAGDATAKIGTTTWGFQ